MLRGERLGEVREVSFVPAFRSKNWCVVDSRFKPVEVMRAFFGVGIEYINRIPERGFQNLVQCRSFFPSMKGWVYRLGSLKRAGFVIGF